MSRSVNPELSAYMKDVNLALLSETGVSFSDVYTDLDVDLVEMREALSAGTSSQAFARRIVMDGDLVSQMAYGKFAKTINCYRAALYGYASMNEGWLLASEGGIVRSHTEGTVYRVTPSKEDGRWGFLAEVIEGGEPVVNDRGRVTYGSDAPVRRLGFGRDIHEAIAHYARDLETNQTPAPGLH